MSHTRFWLVAAVIGVTAALGCGNDAGSQPPSEPSSGGAPSSAPVAAANPATPAPAEGAAEGAAPVAFDSPPAVGTRVHCPVMDHDFVVTADTLRSEHGGRHYAFCCDACKPRFDANPAQFLAAPSNAS